MFYVVKRQVITSQPRVTKINTIYDHVDLDEIRDAYVLVLRPVKQDLSRLLNIG